MNRKLSFAGLVWALEFMLLFGFATLARAQSSSEKSAGSGATGALAGLGSISGTVKAPKEFKAAKVYDIQQDHESNYWIADSGQGGALIKFDQKSKNFTYYPYVQRTDMPKIEVSNENSIWYTTRSADPQDQALGVLYPDKSKIQTLAGSY
jgi:streptogramin lyase